MDDLNTMLSSILGDPNKMEQLRQVAQSIGLAPDAGGAPPPPSGGTPPNASPGGFDPSALASLLQGFQKAGGGNGAPAGAPAGGRGFDPSMLASVLQGLGGGGNQAAAPGGNAQAGGLPDLGSLSQIAGILSSFNQPDKNVDLLRALKPHFSPERAGKIDGAVRLLQLMHAWPAVRESGLLGNLGNLLNGGGRR